MIALICGLGFRELIESFKGTLVKGFVKGILYSIPYRRRLKEPSLRLEPLNDRDRLEGR